MALRTAALVRGYCDAEVVQKIVLAVNLAIVIGNVPRDSLPIEVGAFEHVVADRAVAVEAGVRALVIVFREVTLVQLLDTVRAACIRVAVVYVNRCVAVDVFLGVRLTVGIEVPAADAINTRGTLGSVPSAPSVPSLPSLQAPSARANRVIARGRKVRALPSRSVLMLINLAAEIRLPCTPLEY